MCKKVVMFEKLRKKINIGIVVVAVLFALLSGCVSYFIILRNAFVMQAARVKQNVENGAKGCKSYVETVQSFVNGVAAKKIVAEKISGGVYDTEIKQLLNDFYNYGVAVGGVTLYGNNNYVTYSAGMGVVPTFEQLLTNDEIKDFWAGIESSFVSLRNDVVAGVYGNTTYNSKWGIVSCLCKVYDSSHVAVGLLVADILPTVLYDAKLSYDGFDLPCQTFLFREGFAYGGKDEFAAYSNTSNVSSDGKYFVVSTNFLDESKIVMLAPLSSYAMYCFSVAFVMLAVVGVVVIFVVAFARYVSRCVSEPLCQLLTQMGIDEYKLSQLK